MCEPSHVIMLCHFTQGSCWSCKTGKSNWRTLVHVHDLMRDEKEGRKQGQTNNKAKQHNTPKAVTFPKKNELPRVGLEPTTLYTLVRALYHLATKGACTVYIHEHVHGKLHVVHRIYNVQRLSRVCQHTGVEAAAMT